MKSLDDLTLPQLLGSFGAVLAAAVGGTWTLSQKMQSGELEGLKASQELNLKDAIPKLASAADAVKLASNERSRLTALEAQVPGLIKANEEIKCQLAHVSQERDKLQATVNSIIQQNTTVEIPVGEARPIVPNVVTLGVTFVAGSTVFVVFAGEHQHIDVGSALPFEAGGKPYSVTLIKATPNSATFTVAGPLSR